jgi:hypothetical protein
VYIGRLVQPFSGMIDEVRVYNYAQPLEQIYNRYMESKDGGSSSSLFYPLGIADPGDTLGVQVIPTDSFNDGSAMSNSTIVLNSPPVASQLNILPVRARALRLDGEDIAASYVYADADGDLESGSEIRWYKDNVLQAALNDSLQVSAGLTTEGEVWYFTVRPRDSRGDLGVLQMSYNVTIRENTAPTHDTPLLVSSAGTNRDDEDLIATAVNTFDAEGDDVANTYRWIRDGASFTNLLMPFDSENFTIARDYSGYGNDGAVTGATWTQDGIVGGAYTFDGSDRIMVNEQAASLGGDGSWTTISVEFWVKATVNTGTERLIWLYNATDDDDIGYRLEFRAYNDRNYFRWRIYYFNASDPLEDYYYSVEYNLYDGPRSWHHVVCTYESDVGLKIFVDGTQRANATGVGYTENIQAVGNGVLDIGYASGSGDFMGVLDEVRIYEDALSSAQVFQRFVETKDGLSSSSTMVAQEIEYNEEWSCEVIPNDSFIDGTAKTSNTIAVIIAPPNARPRIDVYAPTDLTPEVNEGAFLNFTHFSSDPDGEFLYYHWLLDNIEVATSQNWTYWPLSVDIGTHNVTLRVSDHEDLFDSQQWNVTVNDVNFPPVIDTFYPPTDPVILEGAFQEFNVTYHDPDLDLLTVQWYLNGTPTVTVDSYTFVADYHSAGVYNVTVAVSDGLALASHEWILTVLENNRSPNIDWFAPENTSPEVDEGGSLVFEHTSSDLDEDTLFYSWLLDSVGMATSQNWTYWPDYDAAGPHNVTLVVSDGDLFDSQQWSVTVNDVNRVPVIDTYYPLTDPVILEGASQEFNVTYHDPDLDLLTVQWYLNGTPTVTADSYTFVADYYSAGAYNVTVVVFDGYVEVSHEWTLTVLNTNRSPIIDWFVPENTTPEVNEGSSLVFEHTSSDPDGDTLSYSWLLDNFEMATTQNWTYSPGYDSAGPHNITLVVSDGDLFDSQQWSVTVINVNRAPVIDWYLPPGDPVISEGESEEFYVACYDPDDDTLAIQWYLNGTPTVTIDEYVFTAGYYSAGVYNVTVAISDGFEQVTNGWTLTVTNVERDLAVTGLSPCKYVIGEGCYLSINVTVVNQGALTETFNVTLYANETEIGKLTDIVLPSGNSTTLTFVWSTTGFAKGPYTMSAVASTVEGETDIVDNTFADGVVTVTIQGDVDGDGDIDAFDLADLSNAYGSTPEMINWNATCDIDGDELVDVFDLFRLGKNYGETVHSLEQSLYGFESGIFINWTGLVMALGEIAVVADTLHGRALSLPRLNRRRRIPHLLILRAG